MTTIKHGWEYRTYRSIKNQVGTVPLWLCDARANDLNLAGIWTGTKHTVKHMTLHDVNFSYSNIVRRKPINLEHFVSWYEAKCITDYKIEHHFCIQAVHYNPK